MSIAHHLSDDLLESYATGALGEGWSLAVATHLALCPSCRARAEAADEIGGAVLALAGEQQVAADAWPAMQARLRDERRVLRPAVAARAETLTPILPRPLRDYVGSDVDAIKWQGLGRSASQLRIHTPDRQTQVRLLRIPAGKPVPEHSHGGRELTLVLSGAFRDGERIFARGDVEDADASITHQPVATDEADCVCLAVTDAPLRFTSWIVRLVQPMLGI